MNKRYIAGLVIFLFLTSLAFFILWRIDKSKKDYRDLKAQFDSLIQDKIELLIEKNQAMVEKFEEYMEEMKTRDINRGRVSKWD